VRILKTVSLKKVLEVAGKNASVVQLRIFVKKKFMNLRFP